MSSPSAWKALPLLMEPARPTTLGSFILPLPGVHSCRSIEDLTAYHASHATLTGSARPTLDLPCMSMLIPLPKLKKESFSKLSSCFDKMQVSLGQSASKRLIFSSARITFVSLDDEHYHSLIWSLTRNISQDSSLCTRRS